MATSGKQWLDKLAAAAKTCAVQDGRKIIHYTFAGPLGEMVEEVDPLSGLLLGWYYLLFWFFYRYKPTQHHRSAPLAAGVDARGHRLMVV